MSNLTSPPTRGSEAADGSHLTVEDTGSTSNAADLRGSTVPAASDAPPEPATPSAPGAPEAPSAPSGGLAALAGDDSISHVFDQTNGVLDRLEGDSDGTADSDVRSSAERADENPAFDAFADTEAPSTPDTDDTRATGD